MSRLDGICWGGHHWKTQSTIATQNLEAWNNISLSFSGFCLTGWSFFWSHLCNRILVILGSPQDWGHQSWDRRDVWASLSLFTACRSQGAFYKGKGRSYKPSWGADPRTHISFLPHWIGQSEIQSEPRFKKWRNRVCLMMRRAEYHGHLFSTSTHGLMATIIYILSTCRIYSIRAPPRPHHKSSTIIPLGSGLMWRPSKSYLGENEAPGCGFQVPLCYSFFWFRDLWTERSCLTPHPATPTQHAMMRQGWDNHKGQSQAKRGAVGTAGSWQTWNPAGHVCSFLLLWGQGIVLS